MQEGDKSYEIASKQHNGRDDIFQTCRLNRILKLRTSLFRGNYIPPLGNKTFVRGKKRGDLQLVVHDPPQTYSNLVQS